MATVKMKKIVNVQTSRGFSLTPDGLQLGTQISRQDSGILFLVADLLFVLGSAALATILRHSGLAAAWGYVNLQAVQHFGLIALYAGLLVLSCQVFKVHNGGLDARSALHEQLAVLKAASVAAILVTAIVYLSGATVISRLVVGETVVLSTSAMVGWRILRRKRMIQGINSRNVLIVGPGPLGRSLERYLSQNRHLGFNVKGYLDRNRGEDSAGEASHTLPILGCVQDLSQIARANFVDEIFIATPEDRTLVKSVLVEARKSGIDARVLPDLYDGLASSASFEKLGQFPMLSVFQQPLPAVELLLKRCFDVVASLLALIVLAPMFALVAVLIRLSSPGPVLYHSTRIGKKGRTFVCYKFRTMVSNAEQLKESLHHLNERRSVLFKISNDPRITRLGRFLRKYSIDELPQLINVLKGDMSLVGPRPPIPSEVKQYALEHLRRLDVVPGITGLWQVAARTDPSFQSYITLDTQYVNNWTMWLDCKILFRTVVTVLRGTGQ